MERERIQRLEILKGEGVLIGVKRMDRFEKRLRLPPPRPRDRRQEGAPRAPGALSGPRALLEFLEAAIGERLPPPGCRPWSL